MSGPSKVGAAHLARAAYVYVRQSTHAQVRDHTESLERQYELAGRAVELGWASEAVVVIDEDLGRSGAQAGGREGFMRLVADVGLGGVGIVLGIEVSRLARNNADWYSFLDLCAVTDTLIADGDGLYHPGDHNDRLVLGLKGTMSEAELHVIRGRLQAGLRHKAAKGELAQNLPVGLDYDEDGAVVLSPDGAVGAAIAGVFSRFEALGSARQVLLGLREDGLLLPRRATGERRVRWEQAAYPAVLHFLTNPAYAGAFVFGRTRLERSVGPGGRLVAVTREVPLSEWEVCIRDHHPGYITWEAYLANRERLSSNARPKRGEGGGAAREGTALLQGLVRCGRCGRRMQVRYSGDGRRTPRYVCARAAGIDGSGKACQSLGGARLEAAVLEEVFSVLEPASLAATARALGEAETNEASRLSAFETAAERARFEAERARRQFDACEPEHRLVARTLEAALEERLAECSRAEAELALQRAGRPRLLTEEEAEWLERAGADVRGVFEAPSATPRERKLLLRALIAEVVLSVDTDAREALARIVWEGGAVSEVGMALYREPKRAAAATDEGTVGLVRRLAGHYDDTTIAIVLSRQGRRTATGLPFTKSRVKQLRCSYGIPAHVPQPVTAGDDNGVVVNVSQAASMLSVGPGTVYRWLRDGFLAGEQLTPGAPWRIRVDDAVRERIVPTVPEGWLTLAEAAKALGVARQTVLHKVQRGELEVVHVNRGKRKGLRIQVERDAPGLFDEPR